MSYVTSRPDRLAKVVASAVTPIAEAMARLEGAGTGALVLSDEEGRLVGVLTDGDIRRAILRGTSLAEQCGAIASREPVVATPAASPAEALRLMNQFDVNHLPVLDADGRVLDFLLRRDLVTEEQLDLSAVIMAGGFGTRLRPLTDGVPKPMLPIGDRPLLERTVAQLRESGIHRLNVTTHYLAEKIVSHFGDGREFGVEINYVSEDRPLGTAGGLRLVKDHEGPLLVINGDIMTAVNFRDLANYHHEMGADVTVGVRQYEVSVPYGVVDCDGPRVLRLREKPRVSYLINAGIYLLEPSVYRFIPQHDRFDMPELIERLLIKGRHVVTYPITEYWLDIGQHGDYERAQADAQNGMLQR